MKNSSEIVTWFKQHYPVHLWKMKGFFKDDFLEEIDVHWLMYPPPYRSSHYILATLYVTIMVIGICGNLLVIFMLARCKELRTPANILVMNLAISDLLIMSKMPIFIYNSLHFGPALGRIGCRIYGFVGGLAGTVSIASLAAISLDRYYVIKFPLNMRFTKFRAKFCVFVTWMYGGIFSSIPFLNIGCGLYIPEGYLTSCSFDYLSPKLAVKVFILIFFVAAWVIPCILITFCYWSIVKITRNSQNVDKTDSFRHVKEEEKRRQEMKLATVVFFVILLWFVAWTPYAIVALLGVAGKGDSIHPLASMVPALFCKSASCVDPFVYALTNEKFKKEIRKMWSRHSRRCKMQSLLSCFERISEAKKSKSTSIGSFKRSCDEGIEQEIIITFANPLAENASLYNK